MLKTLISVANTRYWLYWIFWHFQHVLVKILSKEKGRVHEVLCSKVSLKTLQSLDSLSCYNKLPEEDINLLPVLWLNKWPTDNRRLFSKSELLGFDTFMMTSKSTCWTTNQFYLFTAILTSSYFVMFITCNPRWHHTCIDICKPARVKLMLHFLASQFLLCTYRYHMVSYNNAHISNAFDHLIVGFNTLD